MSHYISTNRSKHYLKVHIILVTKYRNPLLVGALDTDIKSIFQSIESSSDFEVEVFESDVDHIHTFVKEFPDCS